MKIRITKTIILQRSKSRIPNSNGQWGFFLADAMRSALYGPANERVSEVRAQQSSVLGFPFRLQPLIADPRASPEGLVTSVPAPITMQSPLTLNPSSAFS
jgi:hypothetical protein